MQDLQDLHPGVGTSFSNYACKRKRRWQSALYFPLLLHKILDRAEAEDFQHIIDWRPDGRSFKIHQPEELLPVLRRFGLRQSRWKSFLRQLQNYGFHREARGPERGVCRHDLFVRGRKDLCLDMRRRTLGRSCSEDDVTSTASPASSPRRPRSTSFSSLQNSSFESRSPPPMPRNELFEFPPTLEGPIDGFLPMMPQPILGGPVPFRGKESPTIQAAAALPDPDCWPREFHPVPFAEPVSRRGAEKEEEEEREDSRDDTDSRDNMDALFLREASLEETFGRCASLREAA